MSNCPVAPFNWEAISVVNDAHNTLMPMGVETFNTSLSMAQSLAGFAIEPVGVDVNFGDVHPPGGPHRPERPDFPDAGLVFVKPGSAPDAPTYNGASVALEDAPDFNESPPSINYGAMPAPLSATPPEPAPQLPERAVPAQPNYSLPGAPVMELVEIPQPPDVHIPDFNAVPPDVASLPEIVESWSFTPEQYTSALLEKVKSTIDWGLDGGIGLPAAVQDALWARARGRVDMEEARAVQQVVDEFGARGFTEPNGILNQRIEMARQHNQSQRLALNRELIIEEAKLEIENLRFMVQQGIALEGTLIGMHMQAQQLNLQAAQFLLDSAIRVFEAKASLIRLRYDIYVAQAQVYKTQVEAELAKVEIYKAEIEAAKLRGDINEQRVRLYEAKIRSVNAMAEFYNSQIKAFQALQESDIAKLRAFAESVNAYRSQVDAKVAEWQGYTARVNAETAKAGVFDSLTKAYATRVGATNDKNRLNLESERLRIQQHEAQLRTHTATLENIRVALAAEQARVQSVSAAFAAQAQVFSADAQVEQAISAALDRRYGLDIQKATQAAQIALQNGQARVQESVQLSGLQLQALQAATQVLAQLSAGALSAVNYSANIGYNQSGSVSCSTNNNYQY